MKSPSTTVTIAHELRNVAAACRTASELLGEKVSEAATLLSIILDNTSRICRIAKRLEDETFPKPRLKPRSLRRTLPSFLAPVFYLEQVQQRRIRILSEFDSSPDTVLMDPDLLFVAIWNVLQNAIQADAQTITVRTKIDNAHALILIADDGCGIQEDVLPRAFDPFVSTKGSLGCGLTIAQRIIMGHRGTIGLLPNPDGRGTLVRIVLPLTSLPEEEDT